MVWLISPHLNPLVAGYFLGPVVMVGAIPLTSISVSNVGRRLNSVLADISLMSIGFVLVSLPWLVALLVALGGRWQLLGGFVGAVNQSILWYPPQLPKNGAFASVLGMAVCLVFAVRVRRRTPLVLLAVLALAYFGVVSVLLTAQPVDSFAQALLLAPGRSGNGLQPFLPLVALVAASVWCMDAQPGALRWRVGWLTVAGALMFLAEYPRMDSIHLAWSAPLALGAGAVMLDRFHSWLSRRWSLGLDPTWLKRWATLFSRSRSRSISPSVSSSSARGILTSDAAPSACPRSNSTQPSSEEIGVPSWCAVSLAMPTQMVRFSAWRMPARPISPSEMSSATAATDAYGIQRSWSSTGGSP